MENQGKEICGTRLNNICTVQTLRTPFREVALIFLSPRFRKQKNGALFGNRKWMARDISMKARNVSDAGRVARRKEVKIERAIEERTRVAARATVLHRGMSKCLGSEVECVQSLIMVVARKETPIRSPIVCTRFCRRSCIPAATISSRRRRHPLGVYCISVLLTRTHFRCGNL